MPFEEIATIVGRSPTATRQLASRARRRVRGGDEAAEPARAQQRAVVDSFLVALRAGDFEGLLAVLDPDLVVRSDMATPSGATDEIRGAAVWAKQAVPFGKAARFARPALVNGEIGIVMAPRGRLFRALRFTFAGGDASGWKIAALEVIGDPARLGALDLAVVD